jgi:hypothetical protein
MAHRNSTLQKPDAQFVAMANNINTECTAHAGNWQLDPADLSALQALTANANTAYAANSNLSTKNRITVAEKQYAFAELKRFLSFFIKTLIGNKHIPDEALTVMELPPRKRHFRLPLPPPTDAPVISVVRLHDEMRVYVSRPKHDHPVGAVKHHGFMLRWKKEDDDYQTVISTRRSHTLCFERADERKRVLLSAAWVNPRLQPGPWSEEIMEIVG